MIAPIKAEASQFTSSGYLWFMVTIMVLYALVASVKEVQIVYMLFLVNCYLLHRNIQSQTEADRDRSIYYLHVRFSDSLKWLGST